VANANQYRRAYKVTEQPPDLATHAARSSLHARTLPDNGKAAVKAIRTIALDAPRRH
jgi:hypothetical protein